MRVSSSAAGVFLLLAGACADETEARLPAEGVGQHAQPIVGGSLSGEDQNSVVLIVRGAFLDYCTGAVVAPTLVLTARHCLFDAVLGENEVLHCERPSDVGTILAVHRPESMSVFIGNQKPLPREAAAIGRAVYSSDDLDLCANDLALLEVDRPLPVAPLALRLDAPPRVGETGTLIGWGYASGDGPTLADARQQREIRIEAVGPTIVAPEGRSARDVRESSFVGTEGACSGDSGGPLLSVATRAILGVMSEIDNPDVVLGLDEENIFANCLGGISVFQRLDRQQDWLRRVFRERGANPWLEGRRLPAARGEPCQDGDECISGLCVSAGAARLCSVACDAVPCSGDMECVGPAEQRVCVPRDVPSAAASSSGCQLEGGARGPRWAVPCLLTLLIALSGRRRHRA